MRRLPLLALILPLVAGCASGLFEEKAAPLYYRLAYPAPSVPCPTPFSQGVRVSELAAVSPFDRPEMVVAAPRREIVSSEGFQWVAVPGKMTAEALTRDLSASALFPRVEGGGMAAPLPLELTGRIYEFAWQRTERPGPLSRPNSPSPRRLPARCSSIGATVGRAERWGRTRRPPSPRR